MDSLTSHRRFVATARRVCAPGEHKPQPVPRTKVPLLSTLLCPCCLKAGKKQKRKRSHTLVGPMTRGKCDKDLPEHKPKVSGSPKWSKYYLAWLFGHPNPFAPDDWYEHRCTALCPTCGADRVRESEYVRQFSLFRTTLIWVSARITRTLEWIIPIQ